jgi:hypothetical protein
MCSSTINMKKLITISFLLIILRVWLTTGATAPGTGANLDRSAASDWTSPGNILANDNSTAACTGGATGSDYLIASNFNFSAIPQNSKIVGVQVIFAAAESSTGSETTNAQLQNASATLFGSSQSQSINGTGETNYTYGSASDVWGTDYTTLTADVVKDADFGVRFWYTTTHNMTVDFVTMEITYTSGSGFFKTAYAKAKSFKTQTIQP